MHQMIDKKSMYVVNLTTMPELPITGLTPGEEAYLKLIKKDQFRKGGVPSLASMALDGKITYAEALTDAIETGVITEPGKYGIYLVPGKKRDYEIYTITD